MSDLPNEIYLVPKNKKMVWSEIPSPYPGAKEEDAVKYYHSSVVDELKSQVEQLQQDLNQIKSRVKEIAVSQQPDYPDVEDADVFQHLWAIEQGNLGLMAANEDVHSEWEKSKAQVEQLRKLGLVVVRQCSKSDRYSPEVENLDDALAATPTQCLAEIKAQAVEEFAAWHKSTNKNSVFDINPIDLISHYANQLRQLEQTK